MSEAIRKLAEATTHEIKISGLGRTVAWSEMTDIIERHMLAALAAAEPVVPQWIGVDWATGYAPPASVDEAIRKAVNEMQFRASVAESMEVISRHLTPAIAQLVETAREEAIDACYTAAKRGFNSKKDRPRKECVYERILALKGTAIEAGVKR